MSAPVDVLAVLRRHASLAELVACHEQLSEAHELLAAVSELFSAAEAVEKLATRHEGDDRMFDRLFLALARVRGGL